MKTTCQKCGAGVAFELQGVKLTFKWFLSVAYWARCRNYCTDEIVTVIIREKMLKTERLDKLKDRAVKKWARKNKGKQWKPN